MTETIKDTFLDDILLKNFKRVITGKPELPTVWTYMDIENCLGIFRKLYNVETYNFWEKQYADILLYTGVMGHA